MTETLLDLPGLSALLARTGRDFFDGVAEVLRTHAGSDGLLVLLREGGALLPMAEVGLGAALAGRRFEQNSPLFASFPEPVRVWERGARERCPADPLLKEWAAESLLGVRLTAAGGRVVGFLLAPGREPCAAPGPLAELLRLLASRAACEVDLALQRRRLREQAWLTRTVLNTIPAPIYYKDAAGTYTGCNQAFADFLGKPREEIVGRDVYGVSPPDLAAVYEQADRELFAAGGVQVYESEVAFADGERHRVLFHKAVFHDREGRKAGLVGTMVDITRLRQAEDEARYLAHFDALTGLPNQTLFRDRLEQEVRHAHREGRELAVFCLDLDRFKKINNACGHDFGDRVLVEVARRLRASLEEDDTVARMGGDSFTIVTRHGPGARKANETAQLLLESLRRPLEMEGRRIFLSASLGIALYPHDGREAPVLVRNADAALSRVKEERGAAFGFFAPAMNHRAEEQLILEEHLRNALERDEFFLLYQPQVDAASGRLVGTEALLRWRHPEWGLVEPDRFIPLAEATGLILPLGEMVLRKACAQARRWQQELGLTLRLGVNLSPRQFQEGRLAALVEEVLRETGLPARQLSLEITESEVMRDFDHAIALLARLKALGVHLAVDDFGTGYSSLSYLKHFPIDLLKIDRSFVADVPASSDDIAIIGAIVAMARSLGLRTMAEGIENRGQENLLRALGCDEFQGYLYSRPVAAEALAAAAVPGLSAPLAVGAAG